MAMTTLTTGGVRVGGPSQRIDITAGIAISAGSLVALSGAGGLIVFAEHAIANGAVGSVETAGIVRFSGMTMGGSAPEVGLGVAIDGANTATKTVTPTAAVGVCIAKTGAVLDILLNQHYTTP